MDITAGVYDAQLTDQANAIAALGAPILVRVFPTMDTALHTCSYVSTTLAGKGAEFVAAWQHMHDLMAPLAPNMLWMWAPNIHSFSDNLGNTINDWMAYFPGVSYVDWFGTLLYNSGGTKLTIDQMPYFATWYGAVAGFDKPLILSESGAVGPNPQGCPGSVALTVTPSPQNKFYWSIKSVAHDEYPLLHGVVIFDACGGALDYRLRGDGLSAVSTMLANPYFQKKIP